MKEFLTAIYPALLTLVTSVLTYMGYKVGQYFNQKISLDEQTKIENIIQSTVLYVEEVAPQLMIQGQEKLALAKAKSIEWLNKEGLPISETELDLLIHSFVNATRNAEEESYGISYK